MSTITNIKRRHALGLRDVNVSTPQLTQLKEIHAEAGNERSQKDYGRVTRKHSIEFSDDGQTPKVARCVGVPDKRIGIEHWLEDGIVDGSPSCAQTDDMRALGQVAVQHVGSGQHLTCESQEMLLGLVEGDFVSEERLGSLAFPHCKKLENLQSFENPNTPAPTSFSSSTAATALRLRLRVALFKVQTNQTAIPITHLQLPEISPQPLSVFPPSLVRVTASSNVYDGCYDLYDDETTPAPPSSPPPCTAAISHSFEHGVPFLTPLRSSSPSPNRGKPLDFGTSSVRYKRGSPGYY